MERCPTAYYNYPRDYEIRSSAKSNRASRWYGLRVHCPGCFGGRRLAMFFLASYGCR